MNKRVVVIGAGAVGLSVAEACARRGHEVTVIERGPRERDGCSFGNAGMIVPSHFVPLAAPGMVALGLKWMWNPESPFYIKPRLDFDLIRWGVAFVRSATRAHVARAAPLLRDLSYASREAFQMFEREESIGLVEHGLLMLCRESRTVDHEGETAEQARTLGVPAEVLDRDAAAKLDPQVTMDIAGAVYFPQDCHLRPERFVAMLERRLENAGARMLWDAPVTAWRRESGKLRAVATPAGEIEADEFVLCGGVWSDELVRPLGLRLPMQAGKGYSVTLPEPVELPRLCSILTEARVAVTPMGGSLRFGGTMEIAGTNHEIRRRRVDGIIRAACRYFPKFRPEHFENIAPWHGLRPCSPDGLPYLGRSAAARNLTVATGHAMMGISLAPVTGEIAARVIEDEPPGFGLSLLSPDRFA